MVYLIKYIVISITVTIAASMFLSCDNMESTVNVNCNDCYSPKPDSVDMELDLTINDDYPEIPVIIYKGNINSGVVVDTFYCWKSKAIIYLKAEETYSAKAIYKTNERTVFVVDGVQQKLNKITTGCSAECWTISGTALDLELVY
jgi:hypothetical protein